jgi:branched-chain amino acid transport system permease protein
MLAQQLANGVMLGATYALFALGFTLTFGVLRVINLTYGFYVSAGALAALGLVQVGVPLAVALPLAALGTGAAATVLDWLLLSRLRAARAPELASLMVTLGAVLALYAATSAWLGPDIRRLPPGLLGDAAISVFGVRLAVAQVLILATTAAIVLGLTLLLTRTRLGLAIRAMATEPEAASLMGIPTSRLAALVSFLSGALAGVAGVLIGLGFNAIHPYMGETMMLRGFVVIIAGGMGSIPGAVIAGLGLGVIEVLTAAYVDSSLKEAVAFAILVLVLWTRPAGLFGVPAGRRA